MRVALLASACAAALLAFAWPFFVSGDRDSPAFRIAALGTAVVFFAALVACCVQRCRAPRTSS